MKIEKGQPGYIRARKQKLLLMTVLEFAVVIALLVLGIMQTGTRLNLLTVVAIVGCLPACKMLVGLITILPYRTIDPEIVDEIEDKASLLTTAYDMVLTSREKIMPVDCIVISGNTVFGYTHYEKVDLDTASRYIKSILVENRFSGATVKILNQYKAFLARAEGLDNIAAVEKEDTKETEEKILHTILNISM